jgi:hypothetical protein
MEGEINRSMRQMQMLIIPVYNNNLYLDSAIAVNMGSRMKKKQGRLKD